MAIQEFGLIPPFLDVGCGQGDVSLWLARRGWAGKAIDYSPVAIEEARRSLLAFPEVTVSHQDLGTAQGQFATILVWDVLEHLEDDIEALRMLANLTQPGGHLVVSVPSNPSEWRWDDPFYGHFRRYTPADLSRKLDDAGYDIIALWDSTFPVFWILRRLYTRLKAEPSIKGSKAEQTKASSGVNAWNIPVVGPLLNYSWVLWEPLSFLQFHLFRRMVNQGHEVFAVARKR